MNSLTIFFDNALTATAWYYKNGGFKIGNLFLLFMFLIMLVWFGIYIYDKFFKK